jgi:hypothetical protein
MKERTVMLATIQSVTNPDPIRKSRGFDANLAAKANAGKPVHAAPP